jgi:hypothetical protein
MTSTKVKATRTNASRHARTRRVLTFRLDPVVSCAGDVDGVEADVRLAHEKREHHVHPEEDQHYQNEMKM